VTPHRHPSSTHRASAQAHCTRRGHRGFTLIEVMIVVAIVAILAGVALPSYFDYIRRGKLPEAFAAMSDFRVKMEQYYQDNRNYGGTACADATPLVSWSGGDGTLIYASAKNFGYSCVLSTLDGGYRIIATGNDGQHVYTINANNQRKTTTFKGAASTASCWLTKGSCDN
jgi:type IV pilus assembly protein PilE